MVFLSGCKVTGMERGSIRVIIDVIINKVVKVTLTVNENVSDASSSLCILILSQTSLTKDRADNTLQLLLKPSFH